MMLPVANGTQIPYRSCYLCVDVYCECACVIQSWVPCKQNKPPTRRFGRRALKNVRYENKRDSTRQI